MEKGKKSLTLVDKLLFLKDLCEHGTIKDISSEAFSIYMAFGDILSDEQDTNMLLLVSMDEGDEFELSHQRIIEIIQKIIDSIKK